MIQRQRKYQLAEKRISIIMTKQFRDKAVSLGKLMNAKSKFAIPLVQCILDCFEIVFTEEEIDYMLLMKDGCYTQEELMSMWAAKEGHNLSIECFKDNIKAADEKEESQNKIHDDVISKYKILFESIRNKCGIWESSRKGVYDLAPIFPGWIELYASGELNDNRKKLLLKFSEFEELLKSLNIAPIRAYMNHINTKNMEKEEGRMSAIVTDRRNDLPERKKKITIGKPVGAEQAVYITGEVMDILNRNKDDLAVMNCFCRTMEMLKGNSCDYDMPIESCMAVGRMAAQLVKAGVARHVTYEEAVALVDKLEQKGCIHTLYHYGTYSRNDEIVLCNCCVDCCFLYGSFRKGALSQLLLKSYYRPEKVEGISCTGCNRCGQFCPTGATYYDKNENTLVYKADECIGCGQCVTQCPVSCRQMVKDERNIFIKTRRKGL